MKPFALKVSSVLLVSLLGAGPVLGQSMIRPKDAPAEYPPASFTGKQYVDSKGCVFIRAGFDGQVTWVPRVARNRTPVCGFQPTQVAGTTATPPAFSRQNVTQITAAVPEAGASAGAAASAAPQVRTAASAPAVSAPVRLPAPVAAAPARVAQPRPAPVRTAQVIAPAAPVATVSGPAYRVQAGAAAPQVRVPAMPKAEARPRVVAPVSAAPQAVTGVASPCAGLSPVGQVYMAKGSGRYAVRCGPQADYAPYGGGQVPAGAAPRVVQPGYAAPAYGAGALPSYEKRAPSASGVKVFAVPNQPVVRVVPGRVTTQAEVSPQARVLPKHVYRDRALSQDVRVPEGYRPIWEDDRLNPRRAEQTLAGKRQMEMVWTQTVPRRLVPVEVGTQGRAVAYAAPRVSTRSAAPQLRAAAPLAGRFVQVGTFRTPSNAQATAQRLAAAGLPVQIRRSANGEVVMAGPFASDRAVGTALSTARRAGFPDAFPRN